MAPNPAPDGRKRSHSRADDEEASVSLIAKKRRLAEPNASSPTAPKPLAAKAASNRKTSSGRQVRRKQFFDETYEIPDSGDDQSTKKTADKSETEGGEGHESAKPPNRRSLSKPQRTPSSNVYDFPDSGDELVAPPVIKPVINGATPEVQRATSAVSGKKDSTVVKRRPGRPRKIPIVEVDAEVPPSRSPSAKKSATADTKSGKRRKQSPVRAHSPDDITVEESPSKLRSIKKSRKSGDGRKGTEGEEAAELISAGKKSTGRRERLTLQEPVPNPPQLRGILTPSKRKEKRGRKSVAFDDTKDSEPIELNFKDLPKKPGKERSEAHRGQVTLTEGTENEQHVAVESPEQSTEKEEENDEGEEEEDEVCVICGRPESEPPNEIIFCDRCEKAVHQECYNVPNIPDGDWFCKECSSGQNGSMPGSTKFGAAIIAEEDQVPDIPNFDHHLRSLQRVLVDRCTGKGRIKLTGQDESYEKTYQLVEQTVLAGEGNSMLIIGARGSGKTTLVETVLSDLRREHVEDFHVVRLSGFIHTDDKLALKEIWRQLGKEMEVEDELVSRTNNYADTLASLLALLSHPSEISQDNRGVTSKSVVFVIDEFDLFATHARQTLLYNLFDIAQARKAPIAVLGSTTRIDVVESLEKRVKSRFSHRYVYLSLPKSLPAYWDICKQGLTVDEEEWDVSIKGSVQFHKYWNKKIETLRKRPAFQDHLSYHYHASKSVSAFLTTCILPLASLTSTAPHTLQIPSAPAPQQQQQHHHHHHHYHHQPALEPPDSKLHLLSSLSDLDLALLIAAARLDIVAHTDTVNFAMAYDEYAALVARQRVASASAGLLALGGGARVWGRGVAAVAWERLVDLGLLVPAGVGGRGAVAIGAGAGLEGKMWKVDVALEEVPGAVKLSQVMARWCKEI